MNVLTLCLCALGVTGVDPFFPERARHNALERAQRELEWSHPYHDWTDENSARDRAALEAVCEQAKVPGQSKTLGLLTDWETCLVRGRAMSEAMQKYKKRYSREDVLRFVDLVNKKAADSYAVWVRVEKGQVVDFRGMGHKRKGFFPFLSTHTTSHMLSYLTLVQKLGATFTNQTFEFIGHIYDECVGDPLRANNFPPDRFYSEMPILSYSEFATCPHLIVPMTPWINTFSAKYEKHPEWGSLDERAVFRGSWYNIQRVLVSTASAAKVIPKLTSKVHCEGIDYKINCRRFLKHFKGKQLKEYADRINEEQLCEDFDSHDEAICYHHTKHPRYNQLKHKYLLAIDGVGASDRLYEYFWAPGVVVDISTDFKQYINSDAIPYLHFAQTERGIDNIVGSLNHTLTWLREHDSDAAGMARLSTQYAARHTGSRAVARLFQLFAVLWSLRWEEHPDQQATSFSADQGPPINHGHPTKGGYVNCTSLRSHFEHYGFWDKRWYGNGCGADSELQHLSGGDVVGVQIAAVPSTASPETERPALQSNTLTQQKQSAVTEAIAVELGEEVESVPVAPVASSLLGVGVVKSVLHCVTLVVVAMVVRRASSLMAVVIIVGGVAVTTLLLQN